MDNSNQDSNTLNTSLFINTLSLEKQLAYRQFTDTIKYATKEQLIDLVSDFYISAEMYKQFYLDQIATQWGL